MPGSKVIVVGALVVLILGSAILAIVLPKKNGGVEDQSPADGRLPIPSTNAFLPGSPTSPGVGEEILPPSPSSRPSEVDDEPKPNLMIPPANPPEAGTGTTTFFTDLSELQNLIQPLLLAPLGQNEILALPAIAETELVIDTNGAGSFSEYMDKFVEKALNINFSYERFNSVSQTAEQTILTIEPLIQQALKENNFPKFREAFLVMKDFSEYKISSLKTIPVKSLSEAAALNQRAIGFEGLVITLAEKAVAVADNKISRTDFETYYAKHNNTALYHNQQLRQQYLSFFGEDIKNSFWLNLAELLGVRKVAEAFALLPFGGQVLVTVPCVCSFGLHIRVGPPVGGGFFISGFASRIFSYFSPFPPSWVVGNYTLTPVPCLQPVPFGCAPTPGADSQGVVFFIGTGPP